VPVRGDAPWFASKARPTCADPAPFGGPVIASHGAWLAAVHAHDAADAVSVTDPVPAAAGTSKTAGATLMAHAVPGGCGIGAAAAPCDTTYDWLAICTAPLRSCAPFRATEIVTRPAPLPFAPSMTEIQSTWLAADHAHDGCAETVMLRVPPAASNVSAVALSVKTHGVAA
jgi:hypothetical protein